MSFLEHCNMNYFGNNIPDIPDITDITEKNIIII